MAKNTKISKITQDVKFKERFSDGTYIEYYEKDGKKHGECYRYYADGTVNWTVFYKDGLREKTLKFFRNDGTLDVEWEYKKGLLQGMKKYYADGKVLYKTAEMKNGIIHGSIIYYRNDDTKLSEVKFKKGKPVGLKILYRADGKTVLREEPYEGTVKEYGINGKVINETRYPKKEESESTNK